MIFGVVSTLNWRPTRGKPYFEHPNIYSIMIAETRDFLKRELIWHDEGIPRWEAARWVRNRFCFTQRQAGQLLNDTLRESPGLRCDGYAIHLGART